MLRFDRHPHRRFNPLRRDWVLVSPQRAQRPWQGQVEKTGPGIPSPAYDPNCYLCPGNTRATEAGPRMEAGRPRPAPVNPPYSSTFVFDNDYPALRPDAPEGSLNVDERGLLVAEGERGICRVVCFSPRHDLTLATLSQEEVERVVEVWVEQYAELATTPGLRYVQIFENRGEMMGASNPHPHGQIWASADIPNEPGLELQSQAEYFARGTCLLCDYLALERQQRERILFEEESFVALVPFWAVWPFETMLLPKRHGARLGDLTQGERNSLARTLRRMTATYDRVFNTPFPYSMGFHQAPCDGDSHPEWHLHAHFYPPLLRSATIRKFMVGYEMLGTPQRDITPESAAERLRALVTG